MAAEGSDEGQARAEDRLPYGRRITYIGRSPGTRSGEEGQSSVDVPIHPLRLRDPYSDDPLYRDPPANLLTPGTPGVTVCMRLRVDELLEALRRAV